MSVIRLYHPKTLEHGNLIELDDHQSHYLARVMRKQTGDLVHLFNAGSGEWLSQIEVIDKKKVVVRNETLKKAPTQSTSFTLGLVFAPVKNASPHYVASKATELGVDVLQPILTERTIVRKINNEKLMLNAIEAAEQCERLSVPQVKQIEKLDSFLQNYPQNHTLIFCDESGNGTVFKQALNDLSDASLTHIDVLIGPEGGFTKREQDQLQALEQSIAIGMGERIMKADTAMIAALASVQLMLGGWNNQPRFNFNPIPT